MADASQKGRALPAVVWTAIACLLAAGMLFAAGIRILGFGWEPPPAESVRQGAWLVLAAGFTLTTCPLAFWAATRNRSWLVTTVAFAIGTAAATGGVLLRAATGPARSVFEATSEDCPAGALPFSAPDLDDLRSDLGAAVARGELYPGAVPGLEVRVVLAPRELVYGPTVRAACGASWGRHAVVHVQGSGGSERAVHLVSHQRGGWYVWRTIEPGVVGS